jgi:hypothetical protein
MAAAKLRQYMNRLLTSGIQSPALPLSISSRIASYIAAERLALQARFKKDGRRPTIVGRAPPGHHFRFSLTAEAVSGFLDRLHQHWTRFRPRPGRRRCG